MGTLRHRTRQATIWVPTTDLPKSAGHPFYERRNLVLDDAEFDAFVDAQCASFYAHRVYHTYGLAQILEQIERSPEGRLRKVEREHRADRARIDALETIVAKCQKILDSMKHAERVAAQHGRL